MQPSAWGGQSPEEPVGGGRASEDLQGLLAEGAGLALWLALLAAGVWLVLRATRWAQRRARRRRAARAQRAERAAASLLEARGFEVLGEQVRQSWGLFADGRELKYTLIADYLVERRGQRWVAEVKTGERALDLRHGPTRRQLLEYRQAFAVDGVLLVDAEGRSLQSVRFRDRSLAASGGSARSFWAGLALGLALAALALASSQLPGRG